MDRRELLGAGLASAAAGIAGTTKVEPSTKAMEPPQAAPQLRDWIIKHGGDCCGCAVSRDVGNNKYEIVCNECGEQLDLLVSEVAFNRMAEALEHARHALAFASGHIAHDGKPEYSYELDFTKELKFLDETMRLAKIDPKPRNPLT